MTSEEAILKALRKYYNKSSRFGRLKSQRPPVQGGFDAPLIAFSGMAASISFLRPLTGWRVMESDRAVQAVETQGTH